MKNFEKSPYDSLGYAPVPLCFPVFCLLGDCKAERNSKVGYLL